MPESGQFTIQDMARWLEWRKSNGHPTVLLLGARAGALFRSDHFFKCLREFSQRDLSSLPHTTQFSEYYAILTNDQFSETDIHSLFRKSLLDLEVTKADLCLAELVKREHFDEIISTLPLYGNATKLSGEHSPSPDRAICNNSISGTNNAADKCRRSYYNGNRDRD